MLINEKLAIDIRSVWAHDQNHQHRGREKKELPSVEDFSCLIDIAFQASLHREEGNTIQASASWISPQEFAEEEVPRRRRSPLCLRFDVPLPFEARILAKLNNVARGRTSTLMVHRKDGKPEIWGICYYMGTVGPIGAIPSGSESTMHTRPDCPTVTLTGIGSMEVTRGDSVIARIEGGKLVPTQPSVMTSYMLGQYLYQLIDVEVDFRARKFKSEVDGHRVAALLEPLQLLLDVISQRRIGATIILIPNMSMEVAQQHMSTAWPVSGSLEIQALLTERLQIQARIQKTRNMTEALVKLKIDRAIGYRIRNIADLATVDGALVLTPDFQVVSFGTKLQAPKWEKSVEHGPVVFPLERQTLDFSRLGTRHNSALAFVGVVDKAIGFVASADGPIRAIAKSTEDKLWYWPDCRISMFAN